MERGRTGRVAVQALWGRVGRVRKGTTRAPGLTEVFWKHNSMMYHCILGI